MRRLVLLSPATAAAVLLWVCVGSACGRLGFKNLYDGATGNDAALPMDAALTDAGLTDDSDADGWLNDTEVACGSDPLQASDVPLDSDADRRCDPLDTCPVGDDTLDGDGDGIANACEERLLWLDASEPSTLSSALCAAADQTATSSVGCWRDRSGHGNDVGAVDGTPMLETQAPSRMTVRFTGAEALTGTLVGFPSGDPAITTFTVVFPATVTANLRSVAFHIGQPLCEKTIGVLFGPSDIRYYSYCQTRVDFQGFTITANPFLLATWHQPGIYDATNTAVAVWGPGASGTPSQVGAPTLPPNMDANPDIWFGKQPSGFDPYDGSVAETMIFLRTLDATERGQVVAYLRNKWGL